MSELPKISIVTPSFNQGQFLEETILSITGQEYPNLEYIVIDGGSTDQSVEIIKKHADKIDYWVSEKDNGQSEAINKGLRKASGDIIAWLNSDDLYFPGTLKKIADLFYINPNLQLAYGDVETFYEDGKKEHYPVAEFEALDFVSRVTIHQPSVFWRRSLHQEIGFLDEDLHYLMDYDLWMRIFFNHDTLKVNEPLSRFRVHKDSKTNTLPKAMYLDYRKVFSRFINSVKHPDYKDVLNKMSLYDNDKNVQYTVNWKYGEEVLEKAFRNYIKECILQEYTFRQLRNTNSLILNQNNPLSFTELFPILIKNNLGVSFFKQKRK